MKIICIGRNYAQHAKELGNAVPQKPVVFLKPQAPFSATSTFYIPTWTQEVHHEVELVVKINRIEKPLQNATPTGTTTKWGWASISPRETCRRS